MQAGDRARVPMPRTPAPGPLDVALSLVLYRAVPFASSRRYGALQARLGWGPAPPVTQRNAAALLGVSPQRLAQLDDRVLDVLATTGPPPSVLRALDVLASMAPCESAQAALALYGEGVTGEIVHPAGVLVAAEAAGVRAPVEMLQLPERRTAVVPVGSAARRSELAAAARRRLKECGVVRLDRLLVEAPALSTLEVDAALGEAPGVGRTGDVLWWEHDATTPLVRPLQRMLAALGPLSAESLVAGVARHWRYRKPDSVPDAEALTVYLTGQPAYRRQEDGRWSLRWPETAERLLLPEDRAVVELVGASATGQVSRRQVAGAMVAAGYSPNSLTVLIATSPLLVRVKLGHYAVRGRPRTETEEGVDRCSEK